jgi:hypothetical protein
MGIRFGIDGKSYFCPSGIGGTPSWSELSSVKNVTLNIDGKEVDVTTRASAPFAATDISLQEATIDLEVPFNETDPGYLALEAAFIARALIGMAVMSGPILTNGSRGLWADCKITKFDRDEPLEGQIMVKVTAKPTYSTNVPKWKIVGQN